MFCRNDYESLFLQHGISRRELCSMTNAEFEKTLAYLKQVKPNSQGLGNSSLGFSSQYRYISPQPAQQYQRPAREPEYAAFDAGYDEEESRRRTIMNSLNVNYSRSSAAPTCPPNDHACSSYSPAYKEASRPNESPLTANQRIIREQNREYAQACDAAAEANWNARNEAHFRETESAIKAAELEDREREVVSRYSRLGAEPETGTTIAVQVNGQRRVRRFAFNELCRNVYTWVAGQTIHNETDRLLFDDFELRAPGIGVLDPEQSLAEQGLIGRVMIHVNCL
jgi:hypothetical protein